MSEKIMNQRIEKYKFSQAFRDGSKAFVAFWVMTFIIVSFLRGCADEQHVNELKAKQNMYVRVQVEGAN
ncbi:Wzz domain-containing protein [Acinetobacter baumannii]